MYEGEPKIPLIVSIGCLAWIGLSTHLEDFSVYVSGPIVGTGRMLEEDDVAVLTIRGELDDTRIVLPMRAFQVLRYHASGWAKGTFVDDSVVIAMKFVPEFPDPGTSRTRTSGFGDRGLSLLVCCLARPTPIASDSRMAVACMSSEGTSDAGLAGFCARRAAGRPARQVA